MAKSQIADPSVGKAALSQASPRAELETPRAAPGQVKSRQRRQHSSAALATARRMGFAEATAGASKHSAEEKTSTKQNPEPAAVPQPEPSLETAAPEPEREPVTHQLEPEAEAQAALEPELGEQPEFQPEPAETQPVVEVDEEEPLSREPLPKRRGSIRELSHDLLTNVLSRLSTTERHEHAAWVLPSWREACIVLALRDRMVYEQGAEGQRLHPPLPLTAPVSRRVRDAQLRISPNTTQHDWEDGSHNRWAVVNHAAAAACRGQAVQTLRGVSELHKFQARPEFADTPLLVEDLTHQLGWRADECWRLDRLHMSSEHSECYFSVGIDDEGTGRTGECVRITMRDYLEYLLSQEDSEPLYLFESEFAERCPAMADEYCVPGCFDDVLSLFNPWFADEPGQDYWDFTPPASRWLLVGPRGSGSDVHQDPDNSSAWNVCVHGAKRWCFVHPSVPKEEVVGPAEHYDEHRPPLCWFEQTVPVLAEKYPSLVYECVQHPGSLIHVPAGWWHAVWNVECSIAVTHNYISRGTFEAIWEQASVGAKVSETEEDGDGERNEEGVRHIAQSFGFDNLPAVRGWCSAVRDSADV